MPLILLYRSSSLQVKPEAQGLLETRCKQMRLRVNTPVTRTCIVAERANTTPGGSIQAEESSYDARGRGISWHAVGSHARLARQDIKVRNPWTFPVHTGAQPDPSAANIPLWKSISALLTNGNAHANPSLTGTSRLLPVSRSVGPNSAGPFHYHLVLVPSHINRTANNLQLPSGLLDF